MRSVFSLPARRSFRCSRHSAQLLDDDEPDNLKREKKQSKEGGIGKETREYVGSCNLPGRGATAESEGRDG